MTMTFKMKIIRPRVSWDPLLEGKKQLRFFTSQAKRDEVVLSKTVLLNFCPKQANEWVRDHMASLF